MCAGVCVCVCVCVCEGEELLTDGEFVSLPKHHVSRSEVTMDDLLLLVNVAECQY